MNINKVMLTNFIVRLDLTKEDEEILYILSSIFYFDSSNQVLMHRIIHDDLYLFSNQMINLDTKELLHNIMLSVLNISHAGNYDYVYLLTKEQIKVYLLLNKLQDMQMSEYINQLLNSNQLKDITNDTGTN